VGDVVCAWLLLRKAEVAIDRLEAMAAAASGNGDHGSPGGGGYGSLGGDRAFYEGKVAAAKRFCAQVLPKLSAERAIAEATDNDLMALSENAF
jgi:hypothetical protein